MYKNITNKFLTHLLYHSQRLQDFINTKKIREADITTNVGNAGLRLFNAYQNNFRIFVEEVNEEYVEEYNTKVILTYYSNQLSTTAISKYFDDDLKSNITLKLNTSTFENYISKVNIMLKCKFPKNYA